MIIDGTLALYGASLGGVDLYYGSNFIFAMKQWRREILCQVVVSVSTVTTKLSPFLCCLLVFLTCKAITTVGVNVSDKEHTVIIAIISVSFTAECWTIYISMGGAFIGEPVIGSAYVCNIIVGFNLKHTTATVFSQVLAFFMLSVMLCIFICAIKLVLHIRNTAKEVESVSKMKYKSSEARGGVCKFMISLMIIMALILLPYPILEFVWVISTNMPEVASIYVMLEFILLECFSNPVIFVLRPLLIQKK